MSARSAAQSRRRVALRWRRILYSIATDDARRGGCDCRSYQAQDYDDEISARSIAASGDGLGEHRSLLSFIVVEFRRGHRPGGGPRALSRQESRKKSRLRLSPNSGYWPAR